MADRGNLGPLTGFNADGSARPNLADGTNNLRAMPLRGPTGLGGGGRALGDEHDWSLVERWEAARAIWDALKLAGQRAPGLILAKTGLVLEEMLRALIPMLLTAIGVVGATTAVGAAIGGALGFLAGGVGAAPGAVLGGQVGFDVAMAVFTWLGIAFLVVELASGLPELGRLATRGAERAAGSVLKAPHRRAAEISAAADDFANAAALCLLLLLQGVVAWLMKKPAIATWRNATASAATARGAMASGTATAEANAVVAELAAMLRKSYLPDSFATWVERHWAELLDNPRLQPGARSGGTAVAESTSAAQTPSQVRRTAAAAEGENAATAEARMARKRVRCFETNGLPPTEWKEFDRQLAGQQKGLNELTVDQYLKARDAFKEGLTARDAAIARAARADQLQSMTESIASELIDGGLSPAKAEAKAAAMAKARMSTLAALHNPDLVAGGKDLISDFGDRNINSRLGAQWKSRVGELDEAALKVPAGERATTKMNAQLERC